MKWLKAHRGIVTVSQVLMWSAGLIASVALASNTLTANKLEKLSDANTDVVQRVSVVETQSAQYKQDIADIKHTLETQAENQARFMQYLGLPVKR